MIVFEGAIKLPKGYYYTFYLHTQGACLIQINQQLALSTYGDHMTQTCRYLNEEYNDLTIICTPQTLNNELLIYYTVCTECTRRIVEPQHLYHKVTHLVEQEFWYKNKSGTFQVSLSDNVGRYGEGLEEIKLYYTLSRE